MLVAGRGGGAYAGSQGTCVYMPTYMACEPGKGGLDLCCVSRLSSEGWLLALGCTIKRGDAAGLHVGVLPETFAAR